MHLVILRRNNVRLPERLPKSLRPYGKLGSGFGAGALDESDEAGDEEATTGAGAEEGDLATTTTGWGRGGGGGEEDAHEQHEQLRLEEQAPEEVQTSTTEDESGHPRPKPVSFDFTPPLSKACHANVPLLIA